MPCTAETTAVLGTWQDEMEACKPEWPHLGRHFWVIWHRLDSLMTGIIVTHQFLWTLWLFCCKESVFEDQGVDCHIVIYKKYIFAHSDDQNVSHIQYLVFVHNFWLTVPGILGISQVLSGKKVPFVMLTKWLLESTSGWGLVASGNNQVIRGWDQPGRKRGWRLNH